MRNKIKNEENFRITKNLRSRLYKVINAQNTIKHDNAFNLIGAVKNFIFEWLEFTKSYYATNSTKTHIDHMFAMNSFDLTQQQEQQECSNWKNLRVINETEDRSKKDILRTHQNSNTTETNYCVLNLQKSSTIF